MCLITANCTSSLSSAESTLYPNAEIYSVQYNISYKVQARGTNLVLALVYWISQYGLKMCNKDTAERGNIRPKVL